MSVAVRNNVTRHGAGPQTFLFAHGFGCDQTMWRHVAFAFAPKAKVVLFDHVGAGLSDLSAYCSEKYGTLQGYADDVIEICETERLKDVILVGHSVSATIGVLAAVKRPDLFSKMVLICASPRYANTDVYRGGFDIHDIEELLELLDKNQLDWSATMAPVVMGDGSDLDHQTEWRDSVCRTDPRAARELARITFTSDHRADYRKVTTPSLLVECADDALAPPEVGQYMHEAIRPSRREILQTSGHCPHVTAPEAVIAAIEAFAFPLADAGKAAA
jgi:sigma-B regulation protein RsbQ